jgi:hypothetical protein
MITQLPTFQPTSIAQQHSTALTCANCPFFSNYYDRDRGLCQVFEQVTRKHNPRTSDCDLQIESLLQQPKTCTVMVELITEVVEDDGSGHAVPLDSCTVEVTVAQPIRALVEMAFAERAGGNLATQKNLQGWQVATFWQPNPDEEFEI